MYKVRPFMPQKLSQILQTLAIFDKKLSQIFPKITFCESLSRKLFISVEITF